jgi:hypothetical protein
MDYMKMPGTLSVMRFAGLINLAFQLEIFNIARIQEHQAQVGV